MCWLIHRGADRFQLAPVLHPTPSFFFNCQICDRKLLQAHHHGRVVYRVYLLLKCRNIALLTKVHKMKAMVFPVVMYGCESWTLKKAEYWRMDAFKLLCWRGSCPLDCKEIKPVHPKENQFWIFIGGTHAESPILWPPDVKNWLIGKDFDAEKDWRQEEKGRTEDEMVGWHHRLNGHEFEQALGVGDGQGDLVCCSPWGHKESDMTERLNWTDPVFSHSVSSGFTTGSDCREWK